MLRIYYLSVLFIALSLIQLSSCYVALTGNVRQATKDEFPFVVSFNYNNPDKKVNPIQNQFCGGALITSRHVLTASHCYATFKRVKQIHVLTNDGDLLKSQLHRIKNWISYRQWMKNNTVNENIHDMAIVELYKNVSSHIKPARIACHQKTHFYGKYVAFAGWGKTDDKRSSQHLLVGDRLTVEYPDKCLRNSMDDTIDQMNRTAARLFICTSSTPEIHGQMGDSGSPLFVLDSHEIIAIYQGSCTDPKNGYRQNVHISVDHYRQFIGHVINFEGSDKCSVQ